MDKMDEVDPVDVEEGDSAGKGGDHAIEAG